jgi:hypothetical protein
VNRIIHHAKKVSAVRKVVKEKTHSLRDLVIDAVVKNISRSAAKNLSRKEKTGNSY